MTTYVQHATNTTSSGSSLAATLSGVAAGNGIAALISRSSSGGGSDAATATDDVDAGSYISHGVNYANSNRLTQILTFGNCSGGDTLVTVTANSAWSNWGICLVEFAGAGVTPVIGYGENDTTSGSIQYATAATGFSPPAGSLILAAFTKNANAGSFTPGSGYTDLANRPTTHPLLHHMYRETASLLTNHRPDHTVGTTFRVGPASAIYIEAGAAPPAADDFPFRKYYMGVN